MTAHVPFPQPRNHGEEIANARADVAYFDCGHQVPPDASARMAQYIEHRNDCARWDAELAKWTRRALFIGIGGALAVAVMAWGFW